ATLRALLRAWRTDPSRSWRQHAEAFRLSFAKHDEFGYIVRDARGNQAFLRESRPVAIGSLQAMPACLQPLSGVLDASQLPAAGTDLRQLALNEQVKISDSSPRGQGSQKLAARVPKVPPRKPHVAAPDFVPELDWSDLEKLALEGVPYKIDAAPGVGKTKLYVAMLQAFSEDMDPVLLLYRTRSAVRDTYKRLQEAGIHASMAVGGSSGGEQGRCAVTVATVDKLLSGRLARWRGRVWVDEAQDLTKRQVDRLLRLERFGQISITCAMGDARQCLLPDTTPGVFQHGWVGSNKPTQAWFVRRLPVSLRCPSVIAAAATAAAPHYGAIEAARTGGEVWNESYVTRQDAAEAAAQSALAAHQAGLRVVVQCDTHESCARVREQLRHSVGPALPDGIDVRTPAQAKGGTWHRSIYMLDHDIDGRHMCARPAETLATALTRATDEANTIYYVQAA
ncbi:MAG: AAA family ATPase, partial [Betaproteobacteria bacterium]|nr:AAA family ATPase [Betaproteobacteria bacterium]